jgi:adenylylsulfate kinase
VSAQLETRDIQIQILDSDDLRAILTPEPTYSREERDWFYGVLVHIGQLLTRNGINIIFAATARRQAYRDQARQSIEQFAEVHLDCPLETCLARDQKGIYAKGLAGEATTIPGLQVPYEPPESPEVTVNTEHQPPEEGARQIIARLEERSFLDESLTGQHRE